MVISWLGGEEVSSCSGVEIHLAHSETWSVPVDIPSYQDVLRKGRPFVIVVVMEDSG